MNNTLELILEDLQNHKAEVVLPGKSETKEFYLVEITAQTSLIEDLRITYKDQITSLHIKIAEKFFEKELSLNTYGLFVDETARPIFAFNRMFADYDKESKTVVYKDLDDFLLERVKEKKDMGKDRPPSFEELDVPNFKALDRESRSSMWNMRIKYSLAEKPK